MINLCELALAFAGITYYIFKLLQPIYQKQRQQQQLPHFAVSPFHSKLIAAESVYNVQCTCILWCIRSSKFSSVSRCEQRTAVADINHLDFSCIVQRHTLAHVTDTQRRRRRRFSLSFVAHVGNMQRQEEEKTKKKKRTQTEEYFEQKCSNRRK